MVTYRTALAGAFMVLAILTAGTCQQLNEALNDRDLECIEVPDDICARLANHVASLWDPANIAEHGPIVKVVVQPTDCVDPFVPKDPAVVRCWRAESSTVDRADGSDRGATGGTYHQNADGRLFDWDRRVLGTFAVK